MVQLQNSGQGSERSNGQSSHGLFGWIYCPDGFYKVNGYYCVPLKHYLIRVPITCPGGFHININANCCLRILTPQEVNNYYSARNRFLDLLLQSYSNPRK